MRLSGKDIALLAAFPCYIAVGQVLFKLSVLEAKRHRAGSALVGVLAQPVFYGALAVYVSGTLLWLWILSRYSLTVAYPFAALALVAVPLLEVLCFGVSTTGAYWIGLGLMVIGVILTARSNVADGMETPRQRHG